MRTVVFGKTIKNKYIVENNQKTITDAKNTDDLLLVFTAKPTIKKEAEIVDYPRLLDFKGEPRYNRSIGAMDVYSSYTFHARINISENEEVTIENEIFRADLNELHIFTDKIVNEYDDYDKEAQIKKHKNLVYKFNEQMIKSNDKLNAYCKLHNLVPAYTDCIELFKLVYPDEEVYVIEDGIMKAIDRSAVSIKPLVATSELTYEDKLKYFCIKSDLC